MVLTDLPFERNKLLHNRYQLIHRADSAPPGDTDAASEKGRQSKEYATFLKSQERKVGPEGFLDSSRYSHTFLLRKEKESKSAPTKVKSGSLPTDAVSNPSVVSLSARIERDEKEYRKRIKVVEDHMWQHKQEERELKRVEGDIIKNQRAVRHTLRDFGNVINKKRMAEERKLNQSLERFTNMQRDHVHQKSEIASERTHQNILTTLSDKAQSRKVALQINDLNRQYQQKMAALDLKRVEIMRLNRDYETKMRSKEEDQHKLKTELADLAITLNMVAQKGRVQQFDHDRWQKTETTQRIQEDLDSDRNLQNRMQRSDGDVKGAEMSKRMLSADLALTKSHLDIKKRDEQRRLMDTQFRLEENTAAQRQLNETARYADMDLKAKQLDQRLEAHDARRMSRLQSSMKTKKDKEEAQQSTWEARFRARALESDRKKHEDSLRFFSKLVRKDEEKEQELFAAVREAEYSRQKKDQDVRRLQQRLLTLRAQNKLRLNQEQQKISQSESQLEQALLNDKAELDKMHARREESYMELQSHRHKMKEDKHLLEEHQREHERLYRVGARSDVMMGPDHIP